MEIVTLEKEPLFRLTATLRLISRQPIRISTSELLNKLQTQGFNVHPCTLQRDLSGKLSIEFPLLCDEEGNTNYWSFRSDSPQWNFPRLDLPVALAFLLAESYLEKLLPGSILELLQPYFEDARNQLARYEHLPPARWAKHVRAVPNGRTLQPAKVDSVIWQTVSTALMKEQCLKIT